MSGNLFINVNNIHVHAMIPEDQNTPTGYDVTLSSITLQNAGNSEVVHKRHQTPVCQKGLLGYNKYRTASVDEW